MDEELKDKEDVIEDQNDDLEDDSKEEIGKEDVIEDQNDYDKGVDDAILKRVDELVDKFDNIDAKLDRIADSLSLFAEGGGVIREIDGDFTEANMTEDFVDIEDLDFNI